MKKIRSYLSNLLGNRFLRSVSVLVGGTAFAQVIAIAALPVLTRLYTPDDFGVLAIYTAILSILISIACFRFEIAIPIPRDDNTAIDLLILALLGVLVSTVFVSFMLYVLGASFNELTDSKLESYLWLLPVGVILSGCYSAFQYWMTRSNGFKLIARTRINQSISGTGVQVGLGVLGVAPMGLLMGQILQSGAGAIMLAKSFFAKDSRLLESVTIPRLKDTFRQYDKFPKLSTLEALANSGSIHIPVIMIGASIAGAEAGFLMLAMRLLSAPMSLIGGAVGQVYLVEAAKKYDEGELKAFTLKTVRSLCKVGFPPLLFAGAIAPFLIPFIFGEAWTKVGMIISWMAPWFFVQFITSPVSMSLHIAGNQKAALALQIFGLLFRVLAVFSASLYMSEWVAEIYSVSGFVFYVIYLCVVLFLLRK